MSASIFGIPEFANTAGGYMISQRCQLIYSFRGYHSHHLPSLLLCVFVCVCV